MHQGLDRILIKMANVSLTSVAQRIITRGLKKKYSVNDQTNCSRIPVRRHSTLNKGRDAQVSVKKLQEEISAIIDEPTSTQPSGVRDIDSDKNDLYSTHAYAQDVVHYLMSKEKQYTIKDLDIMIKTNPQVTTNVRAILMDWLIQVKEYLFLSSETLHLAVSMIDAYISETNVCLREYQLIGITSIFLASKIEERFPPEIDTLTKLTDNTYQDEELLDMEVKILNGLNFCLGFPGPHQFLGRFLEALDEKSNSKTVTAMSEYLLDLSISDHKSIQFVPSLLSASALYLSLYTLTQNKSDIWTPTLRYYTTYSSSCLMPCVKRLALLLAKAKGSKYQSAHLKYSDEKHCKISQLVDDDDVKSYIAELLIRK